ncbi:hypothetical protein QQ045_014042 [Rhodiola kirilowii]
MASRKRETTGISLLSMYNDEDEEMEDAESQSDEQEAANDESRFDNVDSGMGDVEEDKLKNISHNEGAAGAESDHTPLQPQILVNTEVLNSRKPSLNFVDYGHDEVAMSPEAVEEGERHAAGQDAHDLELRDDNGDGQQKEQIEANKVMLSSNQVTCTGLYDESETSQMVFKDDFVSESDGAEGRDGKSDADASKDVDPLDSFLPPPPIEKCSQELQDKINKFLALKKSGKSFNKEVRNKKAYRNPDFLLHAVTYQEIDQIGSCFSKDVFDPHGYDKSDYYDEIEADMKRELERKDQERKQNQKLEFIVGGVQPGIAPTALKPTLPSPVANLAVGGPSAVDAVPREGRQNKKSKWDKVDGDQGSQFAGGQDSKNAAVGAHTSLLSANNAGAGYSAFAQQRRREREVEEKKSSERRRSRS